MRQTSDKLTEKQQQVLSFMIDFKEREGYAPSYQELADGLYLSRTTCFQHVKAIEEKGFIRTKESKPRAIQFLKGVHEA